MNDTVSDHDRENLIELWAAILTREPDANERRHAEARLRELINGRSIARVREMEVERGLRAL